MTSEMMEKILCRAENTFPVSKLHEKEAEAIAIAALEIAGEDFDEFEVRPGKPEDSIFHEVAERLRRLAHESDEKEPT